MSVEIIYQIAKAIIMSPNTPSDRPVIEKRAIGINPNNNPKKITKSIWGALLFSVPPPMITEVIRSASAFTEATNDRKVISPKRKATTNEEKKTIQRIYRYL